MKEKTTNKLTKNVSMEREESFSIVLFTKPFKTKEQWVCIVRDNQRDIFRVNGVDCYDCPIKAEFTNYSSAEAIFYQELCWILNSEVMCNTVEQRGNPEEAYFNN